MEIDLSRFDWNAVGAIGQVIGSLATIVSLWMLWGQIRLTRNQLDHSNMQIQLAMEEMRRTAELAEENRHESVRPSLIPVGMSAYNSRGEWGDCILTKDGGDVHLELRLQNDGLGTARDIRFLATCGSKITESIGSAAVAVGATCIEVVTLPRPVTGTLEIRYKGLFGRRYQSVLQLEETEDCLVITEASEGSKRVLLQWEFSRPD